MTDQGPLVVLVTGAGKGAGQIAAETFAAQGDRVAMNDIAPNNMEAVQQSWSGRGYQVRTYVLDVSNKLAAQALVNQVLEEWGRIDVLINHALVEPAAPLLEMDEWDWRRTLDVNLTGAFLMIQSAGRVMCDQGRGVILNLMSLSGRTGLLTRSAYVATQMGLIGLTRQASQELYAYGVRVHAVGQGIARFQNAESNVPRDLTRALLFLASPPAADMSGIIVDTG